MSANCASLCRHEAPKGVLTAPLSISRSGAGACKTPDSLPGEHKYEMAHSQGGLNKCLERDSVGLLTSATERSAHLRGLGELMRLASESYVCETKTRTGAGARRRPDSLPGEHNNLLGSSQGGYRMPF